LQEAEVREFLQLRIGEDLATENSEAREAADLQAQASLLAMQKERERKEVRMNDIRHSAR
jgi:hypothetical protein